MSMPPYLGWRTESQKACIAENGGVDGEDKMTAQDLTTWIRNIAASAGARWRHASKALPRIVVSSNRGRSEKS